MRIVLLCLLVLSTLLASCTTGGDTGSETSSSAASSRLMAITEADVRYTADTVSANSFVAYESNKTGTRPVVLVIPEWWGLNEFAKARARELAKLGYFAMAVDMYGGRQVATTPEEAGALAARFYTDTTLIISRLSAALARAQSYPQADASKGAMIGYCFGGHVSLMGAKLGLPVLGVVSFHGNLAGTESNSVPVLICHGEADQFVNAEEVTDWRRRMDSLGATYTFRSYPGATHGFTNPAATEVGKKFNLPIAYNAAADTASWKEMKQFLQRVF